MTVLAEAIPARNARASAHDRDHAVSLETLSLVEHALGETLRSLRRMAPPTAEQEAAAAEYESWKANLR